MRIALSTPFHSPLVPAFHDTRTCTVPAVKLIEGTNIIKLLLKGKHSHGFVCKSYSTFDLLKRKGVGIAFRQGVLRVMRVKTLISSPQPSS